MILEVNPPRRVTADVEGDLRGLTPVLRPLLRWNHNWAIARAKEGLEPYAASVRRRYDATAGVA